MTFRWRSTVIVVSALGNKRAEDVSKIVTAADRANDHEPLRVVFRQDQMSTLVPTWAF